MNQTDQLYKKVQELTNGVKKDFRNKGLIVPTKRPDGSIKFDNYIVTKKDGVYHITNTNDVILIDDIDLAQTAILLANDLALGKKLDAELIANDRIHSVNSFEESQFDRIIESAIKQKDWLRVEILVNKKSIAHNKAMIAKKQIIASFEKLRRIR